ncbi:cytochrome P450 (plasmid) [Deinococcus sp. KNUC1210]|uniref:cytochrome P450 n=1 Tax=Deinococcus sp. KNUC1210 TaxID=2917691 RepID=UPI001EEF8AFC|nr:cytochrome P450 [Deinococcus sp. KNUC1210]ULH18134.1 cytochrome P450 [Deinococcus sp. KNUC1210]
MTSKPIPRCPVHTSDQKTSFGSNHQPDVELQQDVWHLRTYAAVKQVLRDSEHVRQGATTDNVLVTRLRPAVIFQDGEDHREQRTAIARYFTPKTVHEKHHAFIDLLTERLIVRLQRAGQADLSALSMELSVEVAARVVGLTDSLKPGMDRRIDALLSGSGDSLGEKRVGTLARLRSAVTQSKSLLRMSDFYRVDVRPAIQARRKRPQEDVISHLLSKGYNDLEILVECLTYATAGMVTTREFIGVAAWHLLEQDELRAQYLAGDRPERHRILHEILRLEPVASTLWRKAVEDVTIEQGAQTHHIPAGARMILDIRTANADASVIGDEPLTLCPHRALPSGVQGQALSFGDGAHRCPGAFLAIHESDVFLHRLLSLPLRMVGTPELTFNALLMSYELRGFIVHVAE